jgi:hypothetical protein
MTKPKLKEVAPGVPVGALKTRPACRYLSISPITLEREILRGRIKPCRNLRHRLFAISELDKWLTEGQFAGKGGAHK